MMGVYVNVIEGANVKAQNHKGEKVEMNHAPYFGKCWHDGYNGNGEPTCLEETKSFKRKCGTAERRKSLQELVTFDIPKFDGKWLTHDIYRRNSQVAWYDTPDYNNEGPIAICKAFPEGTLVVPIYAEGYDRLEEKWVPIKISEMFPWGSNNSGRNELDIWSVHATQWDEEIGEYWHRTSFGFEDIRFGDDYPQAMKKNK